MTAWFVLPGKPNSYKPPRFVKTKRGNVYAGHNTTIKPAREVLADQMQSPALRDVPLIAFIEFYFKRPQSHYKKGQLKSDAPRFVMKTPDVDNLRQVRARRTAASRGVRRQDCDDGRC